VFTAGAALQMFVLLMLLSSSRPANHRFRVTEINNKPIYIK